MRTLLGGCVLLLVIVAGVARADNKAADDKFEEGKKLREAGKVKEACDAFAESLRLNANAIGTILNVARCAEESGRTGTAVRLFTDAKNRAGEQQLDPQQKAAEEHLAKLVDHVPHLALAFAEPLPPEGKIVVDDRVIDIQSANDIIVDPIPVKVVVSAPGRVTFETTVTFDPKGDHEHKAISVPKLGYPVSVTNTRKTVGKVMTGVGAAVAVSGAVLALFAYRHYHDNISHCMVENGMHVCDSPYYDNVKDALHLGDDATYAGIAGIAITGVGVALWLLGGNKESSQEHMAIVPAIAPGEAGIAAVGHF